MQRLSEILREVLQKRKGKQLRFAGKLVHKRGGGRQTILKELGEIRRELKARYSNAHVIGVIDYERGCERRVIDEHCKLQLVEKLGKSIRVLVGVCKVKVGGGNEEVVVVVFDPRPEEIVVRITGNPKLYEKLKSYEYAERIVGRKEFRPLLLKVADRVVDIL